MPISALNANHTAGMAAAGGGAPAAVKLPDLSSSAAEGWQDFGDEVQVEAAKTPSRSVGTFTFPRAFLSPGGGGGAPAGGAAVNQDAVDKLQTAVDNGGLLFPASAKQAMATVAAASKAKIPVNSNVTGLLKKMGNKIPGEVPVKDTSGDRAKAKTKGSLWANATEFADRTKSFKTFWNQIQGLADDGSSSPPTAAQIATAGKYLLSDTHTSFIKSVLGDAAKTHSGFGLTLYALGNSDGQLSAGWDQDENKANQTLTRFNATHLENYVLAFAVAVTVALKVAANAPSKPADECKKLIEAQYVNPDADSDNKDAANAERVEAVLAICAAMKDDPDFWDSESSVYQRYHFTPTGAYEKNTSLPGAKTPALKGPSIAFRRLQNSEYFRGLALNTKSGAKQLRMTHPEDVADAIKTVFGGGGGAPGSRVSMFTYTILGAGGPSLGSAANVAAVATARKKAAEAEAAKGTAETAADSAEAKLGQVKAELDPVKADALAKEIDAFVAAATAAQTDAAAIAIGPEVSVSGADASKLQAEAAAAAAKVAEARAAKAQADADTDVATKTAAAGAAVKEAQIKKDAGAILQKAKDAKQKAVDGVAKSEEKNANKKYTWGNILPGFKMALAANTEVESAVTEAANLKAANPGQAIADIVNDVNTLKGEINGELGDLVDSWSRSLSDKLKGLRTKVAAELTGLDAAADPSEAETKVKAAKGMLTADKEYTDLLKALEAKYPSNSDLQEATSAATGTTDAIADAESKITTAAKTPAATEHYKHDPKNTYDAAAAIFTRIQDDIAKGTAPGGIDTNEQRDQALTYIESFRIEQVKTAQTEVGGLKVEAEKAKIAFEAADADFNDKKTKFTAADGANDDDPTPAHGQALDDATSAKKTALAAKKAASTAKETAEKALTDFTPTEADLTKVTAACDEAKAALEKMTFGGAAAPGGPAAGAVATLDKAFTELWGVRTGILGAASEINRVATKVEGVKKEVDTINAEVTSIKANVAVIQTAAQGVHKSLSEVVAADSDLLGDPKLLKTSPKK